MIRYKSFWHTVLVTSLLVGCFDLLLATGMQWSKRGAFPDKMLFHMAGGVLGLETSMQGGLWVAFVGILIHFLISFCFTISVFIIFRFFEFQKLPKKTMFLFGFIYTPIVGLFMHFVALQLTRLPPPGAFTMDITGFTLFSLGFSIPIFYNAWRHHQEPKQAPGRSTQLRTIDLKDLGI